MPSIIIGIDPGLDGAIAAMKGEEIITWPMPTIEMPRGKSGKARFIDAAQLSNYLRVFEDGDVVAVIEKLQGVPMTKTKDKQGRERTFGMGGVQNFNMGESYGIIRGVVGCLGIPHIFVRAQEWKKEVLAGLDWVRNKQASVRYVMQRYPSVDLLKTPRCKKPHDGKADAICIAEYGKRKG